MRRRRKHPREHANHERWLVSYADFITLLFAFFVVMYAVSTVNEGKYRVLSETLTGAFQESPRSLNPIQVGELSHSTGVLPGEALTPSALQTRSPNGPEMAKGRAGGEAAGFDTQADTQAAARLAEQRRLGYIADTLESVLGPYVEAGQVSVTQQVAWVEVTLKSALLFPSGSAKLSDEAGRILRDLGRVLRPLPNPVHVEGYTDNVPISTGAFPSNWELSAARAASVVHLFSRFGVDPRRMAAVGYGEFRPVADNASEEGRRNNRRVALIIGTGDAGAAGPGRRELR
jgi:chemotaxis protein MotB